MGVVSPVFDDDSILIIEQNYNSYGNSSSGQAGGDYKELELLRIVSKEAQQSEGYKFYN